jgi:hypothetical protein
VSRATHKLGNEVVRVRYNVGTDSGGDPAIYFRIVLPDSAIAEGTLADLTGRIADTLSDEVHPYENWGLIPISTSAAAESRDRATLSGREQACPTTLNCWYMHTDSFAETNPRKPIFGARSRQLTMPSSTCS